MQQCFVLEIACFLNGGYPTIGTVHARIHQLGSWDRFGMILGYCVPTLRHIPVSQAWPTVKVICKWQKKLLLTQCKPFLESYGDDLSIQLVSTGPRNQETTSPTWGPNLSILSAPHFGQQWRCKPLGTAQPCHCGMSPVVRWRSFQGLQRPGSLTQSPKGWWIL